MNFSFIDALNLLGSLGLFLIGMKIMSDSLMELAGNRMRRIMAELTSNRFKGMFTGLFVTALIQSSSATTVMVVSFVNAGLLNLTEALGVIMGANIGTTLTAWLIAVLGFKVSMSDVVLPLMIFGFLFSVRKDQQLQKIGGFIVGFSMLFIGLDFMKAAVPELQSNPAVYEFMQTATGLGSLSLLLFLLVGTLLTLALQSSSATMAITLVAVSQGWLPFEFACAIVLGENVGTTITANLAAFVANTSARRAALSHMVFNIIGVVWVLLLFSPFEMLVINIVDLLPGEASSAGSFDATIGLAVFHSTFNIINTLLLLGFIGPIAALVTRLIADKEEPEVEINKAMYLNEEFLSYPQTAIHALLEETDRLYREPMQEVIMHAINLHRHDLKGSKSLTDLVHGSRAIISMDFDQFVESNIRPIYDEIIDYGSQIHQRFSLEELEEEQVRRLGYAARDSLIIVNKVAQLNNELNKHMDDPNEIVRDAFDEQRIGLVKFRHKLMELDLHDPEDQLDEALDKINKWVKKTEKKWLRQIGKQVSAREIPIAASVSLYSTVRLFRSICRDLIRVSRYLTSAAKGYEEGEPELETEDLAA